LPRLFWLYQLPNAIARLALRFVPLALTIDGKRCSRCLACVRICPQRALRAAEEGQPRVDARQCILCLCCAEMCPQNAIYLRFLRRRMQS
jgi:ferredoxin